MAAHIIEGSSSPYVNFHFEYKLRSQDYELEGEHYIGIGVFAKMVDMDGNEVTEYIQDITTEPELAQKLIHSLQVSQVSPMCLKTFIEGFLASN